MRRAARGFTLVEVMVVLVILGAVTAVTIPAFRNAMRADPLRDGTATVVRVLERARMTARTAGHRVTVTIDPSLARYWIDAPALTGSFELPSGVTLWSDRPRAYVAFDAHGTASADRIVLQANGGANPITVDRFTGAIATNATNATNAR